MTSAGAAGPEQRTPDIALVDLEARRKPVRGVLIDLLPTFDQESLRNNGFGLE